MLSILSVLIGFAFIVTSIPAHAELTETSVSCGDVLKKIELKLSLVTVKNTAPEVSQIIAYYSTADGKIKKQALRVGKILTTNVTSDGHITLAMANGLVHSYKFDGSQFIYERSPLDWSGFTSLLPGSSYAKAAVSDNLAYAVFMKEDIVFDKEDTNDIVVGTKLAVHIYPLTKGGFIKHWHPDKNILATISDVQYLTIDNDGKVFLVLKSGKTYETKNAGDTEEKD
jgi:hypothetical protein